MGNSISLTVWREIQQLLTKYNIPYTSRYERRDVPQAMEYPDKTVVDKHIQINVVVADWV